MTVVDWSDDCADLCAGTGTIAKAIIQNKTERLGSAKKAFATTWISDKCAYPLQIANIAVTNIDAINIPLNMFQSDVFAIYKGNKIEIKSLVDGSNIDRIIPPFGAIISNLPFVEYNKIASDEGEYIKEYRQIIKDITGIEFTLGKTDLYNFLPFKLYELLKENGKLGIIVSNSWLGTNIGKQFFEALQYYYIIQSVVISNCKRWFHNADVIATLLILKKKPMEAPDKEKKVDFWLINKDIKNLEVEEKEIIINSIVLQEEIDIAAASMKSYSLEMID